LGSNLSDRLLAEGHEVVGMDNFITGSPENLAHITGHPGFTFIRHDVSHFIFVPGALDAIMHFASPASPNPNSPFGYLNLPIQTMKAGALGTHNTLGVARAQEARFMLASTSEIYGDPLEHPQTETYWGHVDPIGPRSVYDEAKRFAEALTMAYHRFHNVNTRIVRIFNTYGPRMHVDDGRVVPNFLQQALRGQPLTIYGDGSQTRSFCYVDDLIEGIYRLLLSDEHGPVNIGNPVETTILDFAKVINQLTGNTAGIIFKPGSRGEGDPQRRQPDITRAREILGWQAKIDMEEGLLKTIAYFKTKLGL
jgi:dTDP-glucose 4,6-dehydratase